MINSKYRSSTALLSSLLSFSFSQIKYGYKVHQSIDIGQNISYIHLIKCFCSKLFLFFNYTSFVSFSVFYCLIYFILCWNNRSGFVRWKKKCTICEIKHTVSHDSNSNCYYFLEILQGGTVFRGYWHEASRSSVIFC